MKSQNKKLIETIEKIVDRKLLENFPQEYTVTLETDFGTLVINNIYQPSESDDITEVAKMTAIDAIENAEVSDISPMNEPGT